ncbi:MAG: Uma2 family endonuclease [Burkholderiales bacterium]|nr:Uma2 family endonuclease [Phycisphaerae bacterium]
MVVGISRSMKALYLLQQGDRLTRAEFERRFDATPDLKRAELIEGVVYLPPAVSHDDHGGPHARIIMWLGNYCVATPNTDFGDNGSLRLDLKNMPQPDGYLLVRPDCGGQARFENGYVSGGPELIVEVSASSVSIDMHAKKEIYRRNGVKEYLVCRVFDGAFDWFVLEGGEYVELQDRDGVFDSTVFPGLRLDAKALLTGDLPGVQQSLNEALALPEHTKFVTELQNRKTKA